MCQSTSRISADVALAEGAGIPILNCPSERLRTVLVACSGWCMNNDNREGALFNNKKRKDMIRG